MTHSQIRTVQKADGGEDEEKKVTAHFNDLCFSKGIVVKIKAAPPMYTLTIDTDKSDMDAVQDFYADMDSLEDDEAFEFISGDVKPESGKHEVEWVLKVADPAKFIGDSDKMLPMRGRHPFRARADYYESEDDYLNYDRLMDDLAAAIQAKKNDWTEDSGRSDEYVGFSFEGKVAWGKWEGYLYIRDDDFYEAENSVVPNVEFTALIKVKPEWTLEKVRAILIEIDEARWVGGYYDQDYNHQDGYPETLDEVSEIVADGYGLGDKRTVEDIFDPQADAVVWIEEVEKSQKAFVDSITNIVS